MNNLVGSALPIAEYRDRIVNAVKDHPVVIITAETGAGKSTQVPQYLLEEGYDMVVTQPRRLAARTVSERVAEEIGEELGKTVGYRTAVDRQDSLATRCLFATDGLALVRELMGQNKGVLILDEVHEWNENQEVLVAWAKRQIGIGADFKVVIMSATLETEELSVFFDNAPVISVPGRTFSVTEREPSREMITDIADLVKEGRNVLVFQPGKAEIAETIAQLEQMELAAEILPLHGELAPADQAKCFKHYGRPKVVVSTNVAQTSVTIDDIDAVVDSGMERRIELVNGVEGLYLKPISRADAKQRKGRAGRTKEGIYIDHCLSTSRLEFPEAEILRKRLDQMVLRLAIAGFDMEELEFFHQPDVSEVHEAKRALVALGCMNADHSVTKTGRIVNRMPIDVRYGRMLVEADRLGVVDDVLTVVAILEQGGITTPTPSRNRPDRPDWRELVPAEHESDVLGQLAVWDMARNMSSSQMKESGISPKSYYRAKEIRSQVARAVKGILKNGDGKTVSRELILKAVCAGMVDHLYRSSDNDGVNPYRNGDGMNREVGQSSLVRRADWLVGRPFDLQISTRRGQMTLRLIEMASRVDPMWLAEVAPQLVETESGFSPRYDSERDVVVSTTKTLFSGVVVKEETVDDPTHERAAEVFARWLADRTSLEDTPLDEVLRANEARQAKAKELNTRSGEKTFVVYSPSEVAEFYKNALLGAARVTDVAQPEVLALPSLDESLVESVIKDNPDNVEILGKRFSVGYSSYEGPAVSIDFAGEGLNWRELPDEGIFLPGGRELGIRTDGYVICSLVTDSKWQVGLKPSSQFKAAVTEILNKEQWEKHPIAYGLATITADSDESDVPFEKVVYGKDAQSGVDLVGYGTIRVIGGYSLEFVSSWCRDEADARKVYAETLTALARLRFDRLRQDDRWHKLEEELRANAQHRAESDDKAEITEAISVIQVAYDQIDAKEAGLKQVYGEAEALPQELLKAFADNHAVRQFMKKVDDLLRDHLNELDTHVVFSCGRERVREHLVGVSGDSDFFMGADPNDVKRYVAEQYDVAVGQG
jgi:HrpA-like RNA helicase